MSNIGIKRRKKEHINIISSENVEPLPSSFDSYRLPYKALPQIDLADVDTRSKFQGHDISFPFYISSMSGGEKYGEIINTNIAKACQNTKIPFGLGSFKILHYHPETLPTFDVKKYCPDVPMYANLGVVELNYGFGYEQIQKLIDLIKADGIFIHINHLQEAVQPEGSTNFRDIFKKLSVIVKKLSVPIIVKEVGHGIDRETALKLQDIGIDWIDVSGTGGCSWAWIEGYRRALLEGYEKDNTIGFTLRSVGIPTSECLENLKNENKLNLIAGGGIRNGLHIAKAIALGAKLATAAKPFMKPALQSTIAVEEVIGKFKKELEVTMFSAGVKNLTELGLLNIERIDPNTGLKL